MHKIYWQRDTKYKESRVTKRERVWGEDNCLLSTKVLINTCSSHQEAQGPGPQQSVAQRREGSVFPRRYPFVPRRTHCTDYYNLLRAGWYFERGRCTRQKITAEGEKRTFYTHCSCTWGSWTKSRHVIRGMYTTSCAYFYPVSWPIGLVNGAVHK